MLSKTKERPQKKKKKKRLVKGIKIFLKKKKTISINTLMNDIKFFMKKKKKMSIWSYGRERYKNLPEHEKQS